MESEKLTLIISIIVGLAVIIISAFLSNFNIISIVYVSVIALMIFIFPYSLVIYLKVSKAKKMEDYFPQFLRDIAEAQRAGMTIPKAVEISASTDYGPFTELVVKMRNLLSWGVPFPETIRIMQKSIKYSTYIKRGLAILLESYYAGGKIADTMEAVSESTRILKEVEKERQSTLQQQLIIIYLIHFIFIGILVALYRILIPILNFQSGGISLVQTVGTGEPPSLDFYKLLFFLTMSIQSFANGIVAGVTREGSFSAGVKHAGIMITIGLIAYMTFIFPKMFMLNAISSKGEVSTNEPISFFGSVILEDKPVEGAKVIVNFGGIVKEGYTDEYGNFNIKMNAPTVRGDYKVVLEAHYDEYTTKTSMLIKVK